MSRPPEPKLLVDYREWVKAGPPKCCHTCEHYRVDGFCVEFFMSPPEEFAASMDGCDKWKREIPF